MKERSLKIAWQAALVGLAGIVFWGLTTILHVYK